MNRRKPREMEISREDSKWREKALLTHHHIRPSDLDSLGHLNHAQAIELFELGRYDWMMHHSANIAGYWLPVVTRVDACYRREVFLAEVAVATELKEVRHYSVEFVQNILIPGLEQAAVTASVWISFIDRTSRRPLRVQRTGFFSCTTPAQPKSEQHDDDAMKED